MKRTTSNKLFLHFFPAIADCLRITNDKGKLIYDKKKIEVCNHLVVIPSEARNTKARNQIGNLVNSECPFIPVPHFRTDGWDYPEAPFSPEGYAEHLI